MGKLGQSTIAGKCTAGKHDIKVGDSNYYEKVNDKWIRCTDKDCFVAQGGHLPDPNQKAAPKAKTPEELFNYRKAFFEFCWAHAKNRAKDEIPDVPMPAQDRIDADITGNLLHSYIVKMEEVGKQRRILASSFLYALSGSK